MGDPLPGKAAVELPPAWFSTARRRRHRRLTGMSGILLFACMFLPAVKGCNQPVMPLEVPAFLPPYLYGLVFAWIALSRTPRGQAIGVMALRLLAVLVTGGAGVLLVVAPPAGVAAVIFGGALLLIVRLSGTTEPRIVATGIAVGLVSMLWFGFWSVTPDALIGVHLALASSIGLFVGCVAWLRELALRPSIDLPRAVISSAR
ncbi:MAG TPA: hypothetical protein VH165_03220 [Kofleriaceae bacterium]|jgi:hypothetical protein|nr:hypothetical protein [Kofleriaceae bacterium]